MFGDKHILRCQLWKCCKLFLGLGENLPRMSEATDWYKPAINGVVTSVCNLREELQQRGHEVKILTLSRTAHSYEEEGVIYMGSVNAGYIYPGARLRVSPGRELYCRIIEWQPDIVHSQCEFSTFFMAKRIAEECKIPLVHNKCSLEKWLD